MPLLYKLFIRSFYKANAGFFLFFFFVFFASVPGGTLVKYHYAIMQGILGSTITVCLVALCWLLYHVKCVNFILRIINSEEGSFLQQLQCLPKQKQWVRYLCVYTALYLPVFIYSVILVIIGFKEGYVKNCIITILFQVLSICIFTHAIYSRINNWIKQVRLPSINIAVQKPFLLYTFFYFVTEKRSLLLGIKAFSLLLLYIILVWNKESYDYNSFVLFYVIILAANAVLPYMALQFTENLFSISRNMPIGLLKRATAFLVTYILLSLPEFIYLIYHAQSFPVQYRLECCVNLIASLFLLTAVQYSDAFDSKEYLKASCGLLFISIFALHIQALWVWISIQFFISIVLFRSGYYRYQQGQ